MVVKVSFLSSEEPVTYKGANVKDTGVTAGIAAPLIESLPAGAATEIVAEYAVASVKPDAPPVYDNVNVSDVCDDVALIPLVVTT